MRDVHDSFSFKGYIYPKEYTYMALIRRLQHYEDKGWDYVKQPFQQAVTPGDVRWCAILKPPEKGDE